MRINTIEIFGLKFNLSNNGFYYAYESETIKITLFRSKERFCIYKRKTESNKWNKVYSGFILQKEFFNMILENGN